jgi:hypothetical protein
MIRRKPTVLSEAGQHSVTPLYKTVTLSLQYLPMREYIKRDMMDPVFSKGLRFGLEKPPLGGPVEFNQTDFARNHLLYQDLLSFQHKGSSYLMYDFIKLLGDSENIYRIDGLRFLQATDKELLRDRVQTKDDTEEQKNEKKYADYLRPRLQMLLTKFTLIGQSGLIHICQFKRINEVVQMEESGDEWFFPEMIENSVSVKSLKELPRAKDRRSRAWTDYIKEVRDECKANDQLYFCRYRNVEKTTDTPYDPKVLTTCWHPITKGDKVFWIQLFIDKYHSFNSQSTVSYNGIYCQWGNFSTALRGSQATVHTLAILPPGANLIEFMVHFAKDLEVLTVGHSFWNPLTNKEENVQACMGLLIADSMQAYENTSHMGNNASRSSRVSWLKTEDRESTTEDILDHTMTRRWKQTLVVYKQQEREEILFKILDNLDKQKKIRQKSGIDHLYKSFITLLKSVPVDPHISGNYEIHHLLDAGYFALLSRFLMTTFTAAERKVVRARLENLAWPKGVTRPPLEWTTEFLPKKTMSWVHTRKFCMALMICGNGISTNKATVAVYDFFCDFCLWAFEVSGPVPMSRYDYLQKQCDALITTGVDIIFIMKGGVKKRLFVRPNIQGLRELVYRVLPMLGNCGFMNSAVFEAHHKFARETTGQGGTRADLVAMTVLNERTTIGAMARGLRWGLYGKNHLGSKFLNLKHPKFPKQPHPLLLSVSQGWHPDLVRSAISTHTAENSHQLLHTSAEDVWHAFKSATDKEVTSEHHRLLTLGFENSEAVPIVATWSAPDFSDKLTKVQWLSVIFQPNHHHQLRVMIGDNVKCKYDGKVAYMTINRIAEVTTELGHTSIWCFPVWYEQGKAGLTKAQTAIRKRVVSTYKSKSTPKKKKKKKKKDEEKKKDEHVSSPRPWEIVSTVDTKDVMPIPVQCILEHVAVLHACMNRTRKDQRDDQCYVRDCCVRHSAVDCYCGGPTSPQYYHCRENLFYLVFDRRSGFSAGYRVNNALK